MGAKEFDAALPALRHKRAEIAVQQLVAGGGNAFADLAAALDQLATGVSDEAALAETHKPKGWQSLKQALSVTAGKLTDLAREIDDAERATLGSLATGRRGIEPGGDPNQPGVAERAPDGFVYQPAEAEIAAHAERLAAEALAANPGGDLPPGLDVPDLEAARTDPMGEFDGNADSQARTAAYLRGEIATPDAPLPPTGPSPADLVDEVHGEARQMLADQRAAAPDADPFTDPSAPVMLAPALTFADLLRPVMSTEPLTHWSYSQLDTLDDCGLKYVAQRVLHKPQVPQWALVGGTAFHEAVRIIESHILAADSAPENWGTPEQLWGTAFGLAISEKAKIAPVPQSQWRASNKGAEGFDWWRVEGEAMVKRYVDMRRKGIDAAISAGLPPRQLLTLADGPVLEREFTINVSGPMGDIPFVSILDQAWVTTDLEGRRGLLITDLKSGSRKPTDTFQLGSQAWVLVAQIPELRNTPELVEAVYYDARKGLFSEPIKPLLAHPWEEMVYRIHTAEHARRTGVYRPRVSSFCNGCSVKYACPIMNGATK